MIANAQEKNIDHANQQWVQYYNHIKFSDTWTLLTDTGYRLKDGFSERSQLFIRTGIGYRFTPDIQLVIGFAYIGIYSDGGLGRTEFRHYQEATLKEKYGKIGVGHRFRVEQRFFRILAQEDIEAENRFRYRFMLAILLFKLSDVNTDKKLLLNAGDEIAVNAGKEIVTTMFNQNRALIGSTLQFNKNLAVSLMYNHQFKSSDLPGDFKQDYVLWLGVKHTIDLAVKQ